MILEFLVGTFDASSILTGFRAVPARRQAPHRVRSDLHPHRQCHVASGFRPNARFAEPKGVYEGRRAMFDHTNRNLAEDGTVPETSEKSRNGSRG